jgi:hypothetical protein
VIPVDLWTLGKAFPVYINTLFAQQRPHFSPQLLRILERWSSFPSQGRNGLLFFTMPTLGFRIQELDRCGEPSRALAVRMCPPPDKVNTFHNEYRYKLSGPTRQNDDLVMELMIKLIMYIRKHKMLFAAANIWPHHLDTTPPLWPGRVVATKLYAFTQALEEFPLATEVSIARSTRRLTVHSVRIRTIHGEKGEPTQSWTPLTQ